MIKSVLAATLVMLAGCGGGALGSDDDGNNGPAVCEEQSVLAQSGTFDGGDITITCPGNDRPTD